MMDWMVEIGEFPPWKPLGAAAAASGLLPVPDLVFPTLNQLFKKIIESRVHFWTNVQFPGRASNFWTSVPILDERPNSGRASSLGDERPNASAGRTSVLSYSGRASSAGRASHAGRASSAARW
ncbi:hypothetical protein VIGAN_09043500, partial [Vigna angularis var. angularis]